MYIYTHIYKTYIVLFTRSQNLMAKSAKQYSHDENNQKKLTTNLNVQALLLLCSNLAYGKEPE